MTKSFAGEGFSIPYYNAPKAVTFSSSGIWTPDYRQENTSQSIHHQGTTAQPHSTNPWSLPAAQWMPVIPQYLGPDFTGAEYQGSALRMPAFGNNGAASRSQSLTQASEQYSASPGVQSYQESNIQTATPQTRAQSTWQQPDYQQIRPTVSAPAATMNSSQYNSRFVTSDVLEKIKRQQMQTQQSLPLNHSYDGGQQSASCCQNRHNRMRNKKFSSPRYPSTDKLNAQSEYGYSTMPFSNMAKQLSEQRLLYKGDTLPTVPDAAISGLPPMNIFEPLPPVLSAPYADIDWGTSRFGVGPYGDFLQQ